MKTPWWFLHKTPLALLLVPVSWIYFLCSRVVFLWRRMFEYKSRRKIICVGGILAGGVGKTPIVRVVAKYLDAPVVMRGYKKSAKTGNIGDEAMMLMRDDIIVHVGHRKSNIMLLNRQAHDTGPIVMDDGMQNPTIKKDISIFVFDQSIGWGNGFMLPAGPLRAPRKGVGRADAIIVIKSRVKKRNFNLPSNVPIFWAENKTVSPFKRGERIVAFAGIGYPKKFFKSLDGVVTTRSFPDHYQYTDEDIEYLLKLAKKKQAKLLTTEKDWVRLSNDTRKKIQFARLETHIAPEFFEWIKERLNVNDKTKR